MPNSNTPNELEEMNFVDVGGRVRGNGFCRRWGAGGFSPYPRYFPPVVLLSFFIRAEMKAAETAGECYGRYGFESVRGLRGGARYLNRR